MIAIPLPFVVALLLAILSSILFIRRDESTHSAFIFVTLCAVTTAVVGLRWTFDWPLFRTLQPIFASCIPAVAWYCFSKAHKHHLFRYWHALPPLLIMSSTFTYSLWKPPLDPLLTLLYVGYGLALIYASFKQDNLPEQVRFSDMKRALKAERIAGTMLLMSASIDGALAVDFAFFDGSHAILILAIGHTIMLPVLASAVVMLSLSVVSATSEDTEKDLNPALKETLYNQLTEEEAKEITHKIDTLLSTKEAFLDPDLTLNRLARKACIPARQISTAINQVYGRNISQVVNEYRIERAKNLLLSTDKTITQIYLDSGFQTKSNFHREFTRVTQQTPSAFRRSNQLTESLTEE